MRNTPKLLQYCQQAIQDVALAIKLLYKTLSCRNENVWNTWALIPNQSKVSILRPPHHMYLSGYIMFTNMSVWDRSYELLDGAATSYITLQPMYTATCWSAQRQANPIPSAGSLTAGDVHSCVTGVGRSVLELLPNASLLIMADTMAICLRDAAGIRMVSVWVWKGMLGLANNYQEILV